MLTLIVQILCFLAILDTVIGNRLLPGKVAVIKINGLYNVIKWNRYFFIPIKEYLCYSDKERLLDNFNTTILTAACFYSKEEAIKHGLTYSNKYKPGNNAEEIWTNKQGKKFEELPKAEKLREIADKLELATTDEEKLKILEQY